MLENEGSFKYRAIQFGPILGVRMKVSVATGSTAGNFLSPLSFRGYLMVLRGRGVHKGGGRSDKGRGGNRSTVSLFVTYFNI